VVVSRVIIPLSVQNLSNTGMRFRIPEDHAPIFSLFTFFGLRPR
jgi:hypothetical protein